MVETATLEQVQALAMRLSSRDQLHLMARLSNGLSMAISEADSDLSKRMADFVALCESQAITPHCPSDSVKDLRELREERLSRS